MQNIIIFDSGIGGLSITQEIQQVLPAYNLIYVADNLLYPYGIRSEQDLLQRATNLFPQLIHDYSPALIVIACNSASTLILDKIRSLSPTPVVGVVPAIKPAAAMTKSKNIGLIATSGTLQRTYTQQLIHEFAKDLTTMQVACDGLVTQAENKFYARPVNKDIIKQQLAPLQKLPETDILVLGCTHFTLIKDEIAHVLDNKIIIIDSSKAIAHRAKHLLAKNHNDLTPRTEANDNASTRGHQFIYTAHAPDFNTIRKTLTGMGFNHVHVKEY